MTNEIYQLTPSGKTLPSEESPLEALMSEVADQALEIEGLKQRLKRLEGQSRRQPIAGRPDHGESCEDVSDPKER